METLYFKPTCPYCQKVLRAVEELCIKLNYKDISSSVYRDELVAGGGKQTVPCLYTKDKQFMYESDDIVRYLRQQHG